MLLLPPTSLRHMQQVRMVDEAVSAPVRMPLSAPPVKRDVLAEIRKCKTTSQHLSKCRMTHNRGNSRSLTDDESSVTDCCRHTRRQHEQQSSPIFGALMWGPQPHRARQRTALSPGHGNTGRRSARMDPRLQDQENSGDAETDMMRQELESARMRYDEDQQGHVMDETPPRIGRVERHM